MQAVRVTPQQQDPYVGVCFHYCYYTRVSYTTEKYRHPTQVYSILEGISLY